MIGKCFECEIEDDVEEHHVVPISLGGTKTIPLCLKCHGLVHDRNFVKHRKLQRIGIDKAMAEGKYKGRKIGSSKTVTQYLETQLSINIIKCLNDGMSLRKIAKKVNCSLGTTQKVKKLYGLNLTNEEMNTAVPIILNTPIA